MMNPMPFLPLFLTTSCCHLTTFSRLEFLAICTQSSAQKETSKTPTLLSPRGGLATRDMRLTTKMFSILFQPAHEIALERSKLEISLAKHLPHWQVICSNVQSIGTLELRLILAKMIWNFNIELCEKTDSNWTDQKVFVAFVKKPLTVKLSPRVRSAIS